MKKIAALLIFLPLLSFSQMSQNIVDTEKAMPSDDGKTILYTDLSGIYVGGNVDYTYVIGSFGFGQRIGDNHVVKVAGGTNYFAIPDLTITNSHFGQVRHNYKINDNYTSFAFYQLQYNNVLLLDKRQLGGAGVRFDTGSDSSRVTASILVGAMYEEEVLNQETLELGEKHHTQYARTATSLVLGVQISDKVSLATNTYFQSRIDNPDDFRVLNTTDLVFEVSDSFSFFVSNEYRYDSEPPSSLGAWDNTTVVGVSVNVVKK